MVGCGSHGSSTGASASAAASASARPLTTSTAAASASAAPSAAPSASADAATASSDPLASPKMVDDAGNPLPQTEDKPSSSSPAFQKRAALLFEAIQKDDATIAAPAFFPKSAYATVKDIKNADKDWDARLFRLFKRDIHDYHKRLGKKPGDTQFVSVAADDTHMKWMAKGSEGNRVGYYRLFGTTLRYKNAKGKDAKLEVTSLISWRGEWFVVHLHGTK